MRRGPSLEQGEFRRLIDKTHFSIAPQGARVAERRQGETLRGLKATENSAARYHPLHRASDPNSPPRAPRPKRPMPLITPGGTYDAFAARTRENDVCAVRRESARNAHRIEAGRPRAPVPGCPRSEARDPPPARHTTGRPVRPDAVDRTGQANVFMGGPPRRNPKAVPNLNQLSPTESRTIGGISEGTP
jgi:hypothetical protein